MIFIFFFEKSLDEFTEELLEEHEKELEEIHFYYRHNEELFTNLAHWHEIWAEYREFQVCFCYFNFQPDLMFSYFSFETSRVCQFEFEFRCIVFTKSIIVTIVLIPVVKDLKSSVLLFQSTGLTEILNLF